MLSIKFANFANESYSQTLLDKNVKLCLAVPWNWIFAKLNGCKYTFARNSQNLMDADIDGD